MNTPETPDLPVEEKDEKTYSLVPFSDPVLTTRPNEFDFDVPGELTAKELGSVLHKYVEKFGGYGLSANQIGIPLRAFIMRNGTEEYLVFNPIVVGVSKDTTLVQEGCLSFPGLSLTLRRPSEVTAMYTTVDGEVKTQTFSGMWARVFLHEYDHTEGIVFTQRASKFKLDWEMKKVNKRMEKFFKRRGLKLVKKKRGNR